MLPIERRNEILQQLMMDGRVVVSELAERYDVTEETIRRDLEKLEADGYAKKTYGGAVRNEGMTGELPYTVRKQTNVSGKKYIAEIIGALIQDGDSLLLDSSTTALFTVKSIFSKRRLTIITNSVEILLDLPQNHDWNIISTGGSYRCESMSFYGGAAEAVAEKYHVDYAILSCKGLDMEKGITDTREPFAHLKNKFFRSARKVILAVDHTKFDKISFVQLGNIDHVDVVVTDREPSEAWKNFFLEKQIELVY
ncbi:MAG: DeoR/GlpR transcriptional regulator [Clostridia bacterium]|nr:DeoR/GlpR transcriptional regulator [Clostridia bacterium]